MFIFVVIFIIFSAVLAQPYNPINYFQTEFCTLNLIAPGQFTFEHITKQSHQNIINKALVLSQISNTEQQSIKFIAKLSDQKYQQKIQIKIQILNKILTHARMSFFILIVKQQNHVKYLDFLFLDFSFEQFSLNDKKQQQNYCQQIGLKKNIYKQTIFKHYDVNYLKFIPYITSIYLDRNFSQIQKQDGLNYLNRLNIQIQMTDKKDQKQFRLQLSNKMFSKIQVKAISLVINTQAFKIQLKQFNYLIVKHQISLSSSRQIEFRDQANSVQKSCFIGIHALNMEMGTQINFRIFLQSSAYYWFKYQYKGSEFSSIQSDLFCLYYIKHNKLDVETLPNTQNIILIKQKSIAQMQKTKLNQNNTGIRQMQIANSLVNSEKRLLTENGCGFGFYYHPTALRCVNCGNIVGQCDDCTWTNCLVCTNPNYVATGLQCACVLSNVNVVNCDLCGNALGQCGRCVGGYYLASPTSCALCPVIADCAMCLNAIDCAYCNGGFYLSSPTACSPCPPLPNCAGCTNSTHCSYCNTGFYVDGSGACQDCSIPLSNCNSCPNSVTCNGCIPGYNLNASSQCQCVTTYWNLTNCTVCQNSTYCTACQPGAILLPDGKCVFCIPYNIHVNCTSCSGMNACTICHDTYVPFTLNSSTNVTCELCVIVIPYCKPSNCSSQFNCTQCVAGFHTDLVNVSLQNCQFCNISLGDPCIQCSSNSICTLCKYTYYLDTIVLNNSVICDLCSNAISHCEHCNDDIDCIVCKQKYLANFDNTFNRTICESCYKLYLNCQNCTLTNCTLCLHPYEFGSSGLCDNCTTGYQLIDGHCYNIPGCWSSIVVNSITICLSCATSLNFYFNPLIHNCSCMVGFEQYHKIGRLKTCIPICGDGIYLSNYEQCDDNNLVNGDGCNSNCKIEAFFTCSSISPSVCILHADFTYLKFNYVTRVIGEHKGILSYSIFPSHPGLQKLKWDKLIKLNFSLTSVLNTSLKYSYLIGSGQLRIQFTYLQQMQNVFLFANLTFDPTIVVSNPSVLTQSSKLNGINAPLLLQSENFMQMQKNVILMAQIFVILVLIQFYLGSYFHKMIGLQTINVIQLVYFLRMLGSQNSKNILSSLNSIKYSVSGYQNAQLLHQVPQSIILQQYNSMSSQFIQIELQKYFLLNVNFSLFPLIIIYVVYGVYLIRKYYLRAKYISTMQQQYKDLFTIQKRSAQWIYDHFVFPYTMMINAIILFNYLAYLQASQIQVASSQNFFTSYSFPFLITLLFVSFGIYCFQTVYSYQQFIKYNMTPQDRNRIPISLVQKIQHDENYYDRENYHPFYILVYLLTFTVFWGILTFGIFIESYTFGLQTLLAFNIVYFLIIYFWSPYHQKISIHNKFIVFNQFVIIIFLANCIIFSKINAKNDSNYLLTMYIMITLLSFTTIGGFVRIFFQRRFRKILQQTGQSLNKVQLNIQQVLQEEQEQSQSQKRKKPRKQKIEPDKISLTKNNGKLINNQFLFQNQLKKYRQNNNDKIQQNLRNITQGKLFNNHLNVNNNTDNSNSINDQIVIHMMRQQYARNRQQLLFNQRKKNIQHNLFNQVTDN